LSQKQGNAGIGSEDEQLIGNMLRTAAKLAKENGLTDFRFVMNNGAEAGQTVFHLHMHLLAGRPLSGAMG